MIKIRIARLFPNLLTAELRDAPMPLPSGGGALTIDPPGEIDWTKPGAVFTCGQTLFSLLSQNQEIKNALEYASGNLVSPCPIYLTFGNAIEAELMNWETLHNKGFISLKSTSPITRMAESKRSFARGDINLALDPIDKEHPFRVLAILSAVSIDATAQWNHLFNAVREAITNGLPIEILVIVGQPELHDSIQAQIKQAHIDFVKLVPVGRYPYDVKLEIDKFKPHVIHLFCHGTTAFDQPRLELANFDDWQNGKSSIALHMNELLEMNSIRHAWLVVFNCCEVGAATKDVYSLTHGLAAGGVCATVGMTEAVSPEDADAVTGSLYPTVFKLVQEALESANKGSIVELDWYKIIQSPRDRLKDMHSPNEDRRGWAVPVLWVQENGLKMVGHAKKPELADPEKNAVSTEILQGLLQALVDPTDRLSLEQAVLAVGRYDRISNAVTLPIAQEVSINAYAEGKPLEGQLGPAWRNWSRTDFDVKQFLKPPSDIDKSQWMHPSIGWGLVLPENETLSTKERATAIDAPEPIQRLLDSRKDSPVFRFRSDRESTLRRYSSDGKKAQDIQIAASSSGIAWGKLPQYLLIYGSPQVIPWSLQYSLNVSRYVGRLDLVGQELEHYISNVLTDWNTADCRRNSPLVWSTNHSPDDISALMDRTIAQPLYKTFSNDSDIGANAILLERDKATWDNLLTAINERKPGLLVTTSHGRTDPLNDRAAMASVLGVLVDAQLASRDPADVARDCKPNGAIWYAHACCSAGSDNGSRFANLLQPGSTANQVLTAVGEIGAMVAPLPRHLLGSSTPLRAFVGHVEPTFNWTLKHPDTGQIMSQTIQYGLYNCLYNDMTIGQAMHSTYEQAGQLFSVWMQAKDKMLSGDQQQRKKAENTALWSKLAGIDKQCCVILGDPTVKLVQ